MACFLTPECFWHAPTDPGTDLVITAFELRPAIPVANQPVEILVTIKNAGHADITKPFWVDLYVDPTALPQPNLLWPQLSSYGSAWRVYNLGAGDSITLSTLTPNDPRAPDGRYSNFDTFFSGTHRVYVLVDSFAEGKAYGALGEDYENNNLLIAEVTPY